jgi:tricorn protease
VATTNKSVVVTIALEGIQNRALAVPVPAGNYSRLTTAAKHLLWLERETDSDKSNLVSLLISSDEPKPKTLVEDVKSLEVSNDGKKVLVHKGDAFYVIDADSAAPAKLDKAVDLSGWTFTVDPRLEWRQMFVEAWRLQRDYFYDRDMHQVDWPKMLKKYLPLVDRVTDREELSDVVADMVSELSALHTFVRAGDIREGPDQVKPAALGAVLRRDEKRGGYRVERVYQSDPDYPDRRSPLAKPGSEVKVGEIIESINGVATLTVPHPASLLRNQAGRQVLLRVQPRDKGQPRDVVVTPITVEREADLRYDDWELSRRQMVEQLGGGRIGYVHLRAMGGANIAEWMRDYYPVFKRDGLIIDVRHNRGGNIDSWILGRLLRKAWFYWQPRAGDPYWNMQYAFRGKLVVLCNERTASDGEAFTEGFRRLGLGKVIGTRTWGGEIWLSLQNWLVDKGVASAAETGVYGPEGKWLIEGHGVDPDIVVDNLPHATFKGEDAQLKAAVAHLLELIRQDPVAVPAAPPYPDKRLR